MDAAYVISTEEILWGGALLAVTMILHGLGMVTTLRVSRRLKQRFERMSSRSFAFGVAVLVVAAWMIILINVVEIAVWAAFYVWRGALDNPHAAFYYALVNYTTLDSGYLPQRWRLLEGILAMAGLLTLAWSTGVLLMLAQEFQDRALRADKARPKKEPHPAPEAHDRADDSDSRAR